LHVGSKYIANGSRRAPAEHPQNTRRTPANGAQRAPAEHPQNTRRTPANGSRRAPSEHPQNTRRTPANGAQRAPAEHPKSPRRTPAEHPQNTRKWQPQSPLRTPAEHLAVPLLYPNSAHQTDRQSDDRQSRARAQRETRSTHRACPGLRAQPATAAWCQTISQWTGAGGY